MASSQPHRFADWEEPSLRPIYHATLHYARAAQALARHSGRCDSDQAWICGLMAPLGWLALAAVAPSVASGCMSDCRSAACPGELQRRRFGLDAAAVARRLNGRWRLPAWLAAVTGHLAVPADIAFALGGDADLFRVVQLAAALVDEGAESLKLTGGLAPAPLCRNLELHPREVESRLREALMAESRPDTGIWEDPARVPLLPELLNAAVERDRLREVAGSEFLQHQLDVLHEALFNSRADEGESLRQQKLTALAEFAAGAAHEINNPLAVISGNTQFLLNRETDLDRRETLQKIIKQTQRIHHILTDVLLFARPTAPKKQPADAAAIVRDAADGLQALAAERKVTLELPAPPTPLLVHADREQITRALAALLRNAIEAAAEGGWAGVRVETPQHDLLHFVVEDSGPGPDPAHRNSLFDPFFSGRSAGRGRGLGLPIAWRLARLHGGDVLLADSATGPTRFVLSLPLAPVSLPTLPVSEPTPAPSLPLPAAG